MNWPHVGSKVSRRILLLLGLTVLVTGACWTLTNRNAIAEPLAQEQNAKPEALPAPGTYQIDPVHSFVYFSAWHHVVGSVRGRFDTTTGTITVSADPAQCALDVTINAFSVNTQFTERDEDLRGPAFFDVRKFPTMTYQGRGVHPLEHGQWRMDGTLTIRGASVVVPITFTFKGLFPDTPANRPPRASFHAVAGTKRADFGMLRDNKAELGVPPVPGNDVDIEIDIEANKVQPK